MIGGSPYASLDAALAERWPLVGQFRSAHQSTRGGPLDVRDRPYLAELLFELLDLPQVTISKAVQTSWTELLLLYVLYVAGWEGRFVGYFLPDGGKRNDFVQTRIDPLLKRVPAYRARAPGGARGPGMAGLTPDRDDPKNLRIKRFGAGMMRFLNASKPADFFELSLDIAVVDELDVALTHPGVKENLTMLDDRLSASPAPQKFFVGNPTIPGYGISERLEESDGRRWFHQCKSCGHRQAIRWETHFVRHTDRGWLPRDMGRFRECVGTYRGGRRRRGQGRAGAGPGLDPSAAPAGWLNGRLEALALACSRGQAPDLRPLCTRCERPFERVRQGGLWVPERPDTGSHRGYTVGAWDLLSFPAWRLLLEWRQAQGSSAKLARFIRNRGGQAYEGRKGGVTTELLARAATGIPLQLLGGADTLPSHHWKGKRMCAGIDVGSHAQHLMISELGRKGEVAEAGGRQPQPRQVVLAGAVETFEEVKDLLARFHVRCAVVDAGPDFSGTRDLQTAFHRGDWKQFGCQVWRCEFASRRATGSAEFDLHLKEAEGIVQVDRTQLLDAAVDDLHNRDRVLPRDILGLEGFESQMKAPKRQLIESKTGERFVWTKGEDHYFLAHGYLRLAEYLLDTHARPAREVLADAYGFLDQV